MRILDNAIFSSSPNLYNAEPVEEHLTQQCNACAMPNVDLDQSKEVADFPILFGLTKHEKYYKIYHPKIALPTLHSLHLFGVVHLVVKVVVTFFYCLPEPYKALQVRAESAPDCHCISNWGKNVFVFASFEFILASSSRNNYVLFFRL